jgi:hypothetical protein
MSKLMLLTIEEVFESISVGDSIYFDSGHRQTSILYHVRCKVDGRLVMRRWRKCKSRWEYDVLGREWLTVNNYNITIRKAKERK